MWRVSVVLAALGALLLAGPAHAAPPKLPDPTWKSVAKEVLVPMDDGVKIAMTIAWPSKDGSTPAPGRFPVVLGLTPYGRNGVCGCFAPDFFATRGMVGAVADVRGTGGSGGTLEGNYFSPREARDGYNVVEYLGTQPWSTGKVGMAGGSYVGITQYLTAEQQPPHLAVITPAVAISDLYRDGFAHGGIPNLFFDTQYIAVQGAPGALGPNSDPALLQATLEAKAGQSPPGTIAFDYLSRPNDDGFYRDRSPIYNADRIQVPVLDIGQWRDGLLRGETEMYEALARRKGVETRLHMGPCVHKGCGAPFAPFTNPPGQEDLAAVAWEFLAKYLTGADTPERPPVQFYVQQRNKYAVADTWPSADTGYQRFRLGTGKSDYVNDPAAGFSMAFDRFGTVAATPYLPTDQRLESGHGITSRWGPFDKPVTVAGPIALHLVAASSAADTDWHAKLADVAPDGTESPVTDGALRASHRELDLARTTPARPYHTHTNPQPLEPGRFYDYEVEIWPTAYELTPGHKLQLRVTSSDLPTHLPGTYYIDRDHPELTRIDLNPPATNTVDLSASYLLLPVAGSAGGQAGVKAAGCTLRRVSRHVQLRRGRRTTLRVRLTESGRPAAGSLVRLRGAGLRRSSRTDRRGIATFRVRSRRGGRAGISAVACAGRLAISRR